MSDERALWTSAEIAAAVNGSAGKRFAVDMRVRVGHLDTATGVIF